MQFRIFRIPVQVSTAFWLTALLFGMVYRSGPLLVSSAVVLFLAVLAHELGHALTARAFGTEPTVLLHGLGGTTSYQGGRLGRWRSILVTAAGPFAGFALGALCLLFARLVPLHGEFWPRVLEQAKFYTFYYGFLNLVPVLPLDGGIILSEALGPKRARVSLLVSSLFGAAICAFFLVTRNLFPAFLFGLATLQSVRALWAQGEVRAEQEARESAAAAQLELAGRALDEERLTEARSRAAASLALVPAGPLGDRARRLLAAASLGAGEGKAALALLSALEAPREDDDVLRAQALDAIGERASAFALLERAAKARPSGPAFASLMRGLLATDQLPAALRLGEAFQREGSMEGLSLLASALTERGQVDRAAGLLLSLFARTADPRFAFEAALCHARGGALDASLDDLESALSAGFRDRSRLEGDSALGPLRQDPRFTRLVERLTPS